MRALFFLLIPVFAVNANQDLAMPNRQIGFHKMLCALFVFIT